MKISRPVLYILIGAVAIGAFYLTNEEVVARKGATKKKTTSIASKLPEGFTEADLTAKFSRIAEPPKDAFVPIVVRSNEGGAETALSPNAVPSVLTGGDPNWVYTGMAEIDGIPMGLLENKVTGEGVFLKHSESWKMATVTGISPFSLILVAKSGKNYTLTITESENRSSGLLANNGFAPVNPNMRGNIGNGFEIQPNPQDGRPNRNPVVANNGQNEIEVRDGNN
jgi:hypothetical protein